MLPERVALAYLAPMKTHAIAILLMLTTGVWPAAGQPLGSRLPQGEAVVRQSIARHDPQGAWGRGRWQLTLEETRPGRSSRHTALHFDFRKGTFLLSQKTDGHRLLRRLGADGTCSFSLDGRKKLSAEEAERYRPDCARTTLLRNYYDYLWGLPMTLQDPGTRIDARVAVERFNDQPCLRVRVTYPPEVGTDVWYFYFDPQTFALLGCRFYHDEAAGDGEFILFEDELTVDGVRLPRKRHWFTNRDNRYLGTDILVEARHRP